MTGIRIRLAAHQHFCTSDAAINDQCVSPQTAANGTANDGTNRHGVITSTTVNQSGTNSSIDGDAVCTGVAKNLAASDITGNDNGISALATGKSGCSCVT